MGGSSYLGPSKRYPDPILQSACPQESSLALVHLKYVFLSHIVETHPVIWNCGCNRLDEHLPPCRHNRFPFHPLNLLDIMIWVLEARLSSQERVAPRYLTWVGEFDMEKISLIFLVTSLGVLHEKWRLAFLWFTFWPDSNPNCCRVSFIFLAHFGLALKKMTSSANCNRPSLLHIGLSWGKIFLQVCPICIMALDRASPTIKYK